MRYFFTLFFIVFSIFSLKSFGSEGGASGDLLDRIVKNGKNLESLHFKESEKPVILLLLKEEDLYKNLEALEFAFRLLKTRDIYFLEDLIDILKLKTNSESKEQAIKPYILKSLSSQYVTERAGIIDLTLRIIKDMVIINPRHSSSFQGDKELIERLTFLFQNDIHQKVRIASLRALEYIVKKDDKDFIKKLEKRLEEERDVYVRAVIIDIFPSLITDVSSYPDFIKLIKKRAETFQQNTVEQLSARKFLHYHVPKFLEEKGYYLPISDKPVSDKGEITVIGTPLVEDKEKKKGKMLLFDKQKKQDSHGLKSKKSSSFVSHSKEEKRFRDFLKNENFNRIGSDEVQVSIYLKHHLSSSNQDEVLYGLRWLSKLLDAKKSSSPYKMAFYNDRNLISSLLLILSKNVDSKVKEKTLGLLNTIIRDVLDFSDLVWQLQIIKNVAEDNSKEKQLIIDLLKRYISEYVKKEGKYPFWYDEISKKEKAHFLDEGEIDFVEESSKEKPSASILSFPKIKRSKSKPKEKKCCNIHVLKKKPSCSDSF